MNAEYDFALLTLKALFRNSSVKMFESLAQVIVNRIFGSGVLKMEGEQKNPYNAIILEGNYQKNGDMAIYSLASKSTNSYYLDNNIITKVEIDSAELSTREVDSTGDNTISWIGLSGYMNFAVIGAPMRTIPSPISIYSPLDQIRTRTGHAKV